jgi:hypothetical protein
MLMDSIRQERQGWNIGILPQSTLEKRRKVSAVMDFHFLRADHSPSPLSLDAAHRSMAAWHPPPKSITMGDLVEPVWRCHWTNLDGLEETGEIRHQDILDY